MGVIFSCACWDVPCTCPKRAVSPVPGYGLRIVWHKTEKSPCPPIGGRVFTAVDNFFYSDRIYWDPEMDKKWRRINMRRLVRERLGMKWRDWVAKHGEVF